MYPNMAERRLRKELNELYKLQPSNCCAWPVTGDLMLWEATILGVRDTPYYLGVFSLRLKFNRNYPFMAPRVNFLTKIYHCNIDFDGYICWDLLSTKWTALINVSTILHAVCALMREPNADDPCDELMAALYRDNRQEYNNNAIDWTLRYAIAPSVTLPPLQLQCQPVMIEEQDDDDEDGDRDGNGDGDDEEEDDDNDEAAYDEDEDNDDDDEEDDEEEDEEEEDDDEEVDTDDTEPEQADADESQLETDDGELAANEITTNA